MRRRFRWDKKYLYWGITAFLVIGAALVFNMLLRSLPDLSSGWNKIIAILAPFVWGLVITYLLTPMTKAFEKLFSSKKNEACSGKG